jgi:hypothetical protein
MSGALIGLGRGLINFSTILGEHEKMNREDKKEQLRLERMENLEKLRMQHAKELQAGGFEHAKGLQVDQQGFLERQQTASHTQARNLQDDQQEFLSGLEEKRHKNEISLAAWKDSAQLEQVEKIFRLNNKLEGEKKDQQLQELMDNPNIPEDVKRLVAIQYQSPEAAELLITLIKSGKDITMKPEDLLKIEERADTELDLIKENKGEWNQLVSELQVLWDEQQAEKGLAPSQISDLDIKRLYMLNKVEEYARLVGAGTSGGALRFFGGTGTEGGGVAPTTGAKEYEASEFKGILERLNSMSPKEQQEAFAQLGPKTQAGVMNLSANRGTNTPAPTAGSSATTPDTGGGTYAELQAHAGGYAATREAAKEKAIVERWNQENPTKKITKSSELKIGLRNATWKAVQREQ